MSLRKEIMMAKKKDKGKKGKKDSKGKKKK
jgi:hypothetical protein